MSASLKGPMDRPEPFEAANDRAAAYQRQKELLAEIRVALGATVDTRDEDLPTLARAWAASEPLQGVRGLLSELSEGFCSDAVDPALVTDLFQVVSEVSRCVYGEKSGSHPLRELPQRVRALKVELDELKAQRFVAAMMAKGVSFGMRLFRCKVCGWKGEEIDLCLDRSCSKCFSHDVEPAEETAAAASVPLDWIESHDSQDNTSYEAFGPYHGLYGEVFSYRIAPVLRENAVWFSTCGSDSELIPAGEGEEFQSLAEAQADCQRRDDALRLELAREGGES